jgi:CubicO group peptidase (beta-lactamase class C family)
MKLWERAAVAVLSASLWPAVASADEFDGVRDSIRHRLLAERVPAIAVAVWRNGKIVWEQGFGWADRERQIAADEHTPFSIASLSKTMTSTAVMTLVQAGKIELDAPANDYLGSDPIQSRVGEPRAVTVRQLLNHTSGLPPADNFFYGAAQPLTPTLSQTIRRYGIVMAQPGERYRYSNLGYGILGHMIAQVSGKSYADYLRQQVFLPLGMTRSAVGVAPGLAAHRAARYDFDRNPIAEYVSAEPASSAVYASVHDLARFGMFLLKNRLADQMPVLSDPSLDRMWSDTTTTSSSNRYGLGVNVAAKSGYRIIGHAGSMSGVHSDFAVVPERNLGVVVLSNADGGAGDLRDEILAKLLSGWRDVSTPPQPESAFVPTAEMIGSWRGNIHTYEGDRPIRLQVQASGDVHIRIGGEPAFAGRSTLLQEALLNQVVFKDGELRGTTLARIETSDTQRHPHTVSLNLKLQGGKLSGAALAVSTYEGFWIYALPYWTELERD